LAKLELRFSHHLRRPHLVFIMVLLGSSAFLCLVSFLLFCCLDD
jgi:hypothetical protein